MECDPPAFRIRTSSFRSEPRGPPDLQVQTCFADFQSKEVAVSCTLVLSSGLCPDRAPVTPNRCVSAFTLTPCPRVVLIASTSSSVSCVRARLLGSAAASISGSPGSHQVRPRRRTLDSTRKPAAQPAVACSRSGRWSPQWRVNRRSTDGSPAFVFCGCVGAAMMRCLYPRYVQAKSMSAGITCKRRFCVLQFIPLLQDAVSTMRATLRVSQRITTHISPVTRVGDRSPHADGGF